MIHLPIYYAAKAVHHGVLLAMAHVGTTAPAVHPLLGPGLTHGTALVAGTHGTAAVAATHGSGLPAALIHQAAAHGGKALGTHVASSTGAAVAGHAAVTPSVATVSSLLAAHGALHAFAVHTTVSGAATLSGAGAATASPQTVRTAKTFAKAFAKGFLVTKVKRRVKARVDLRELKTWFVAEAQARPGTVLFTATGAIKRGQFVPAAPTGDGPVTLLQGRFDAATGTLQESRIVRVTSLSASVRRSHRQTGMTVYATPRAA